MPFKIMLRVKVEVSLFIYVQEKLSRAIENKKMYMNDPNDGAN